MKINPDMLTRPRKETRPFSFTDPTNPGQPWAMSLGPLDPLEDDAALDYADHLERKYILGGFVWEEDGEWHDRPLPIHAVGGQGITVSRRSLVVAARLERMQGLPLPESGYTAEEILRLAPCMPDAFAHYRALSMKLVAGEEGWVGKGKRADSGNASPQA